jgi:vacuolar iron transporter family protein
MTHKNKSIMSGVSFGFTSGVITTLGLILGLNASTDSKLAIIGGILTIAFADAMSDSLGMHVSQESEGHTKKSNLWLTAISTFITKLIAALTFVIPFIFLPTSTAVIICIVWGLLIQTVFSYSLAIETKEKPLDVIMEHGSISIVVIIASTLIGELLKKYFG